MSLKSINILKKVNDKRTLSFGLIKNNIRCFATANPEEIADKTSLYDFHVANRGKMVNFAGYMLPVQYGDLGIAASHKHTRKNASVFDVSHMLQTYVRGKDAIQCFESLCTADIQNLANGGGSLTVFTNQNGGILDDLIVNKVSSDFLYVVSNAARKHHDSQLIREAVEHYCKKGKSVEVEFLDPSDRALLAVQGPSAVKAVQALSSNKLNELYFMNTTSAELAGVPDCRITRCGYTGEDGVEISIPAKHASMIAEILLNSKEADVKLAGLGARDSLRLEAGMCLYGSDIDETTTPVEAGLGWLVAKRRREEANFPGSDIILKQLASGCTRRRIGVRMDSGPPARHDILIFYRSNNMEIGKITSGCPSPSLNYNIAMGYVGDEYKKPGTKIELKVRGKFYPAEIAAMPFVKTNYYTKPK